MWKALLPAAVALVTLGLSLVSGETAKRDNEQRQVLALAQTTAPAVPDHAGSTAKLAVDAASQADRTAVQPVALVIGNAAYPDAGLPLTQPLNNARTLAAALKDEGFDVTLGENLTKHEMEQTFATFEGKIQQGATALIFFSGFGIQAARQTYLVPVNAHIWNEADVRRAGVNLEPLLADIDTRGAGAKLVVLDASRRNPFERRFRGLSTGLAAIHAPDDTLVMYAAAPGKVISDGEDEVSPLVDELISHIRSSRNNAEAAFNQTRLAVSQATHRAQVPWVSSSLVEDVPLATAEPAKNQQHSAW